MPDLSPQPETQPLTQTGSRKDPSSWGTDYGPQSLHLRRARDARSKSGGQIGGSKGEQGWAGGSGWSEVDKYLAGKEEAGTRARVEREQGSKRLPFRLRDRLQKDQLIV